MRGARVLCRCSNSTRQHDVIVLLLQSHCPSWHVTSPIARNVSLPKRNLESKTNGRFAQKQSKRGLCSVSSSRLESTPRTSQVTSVARFFSRLNRRKKFPSEIRLSHARIDKAKKSISGWDESSRRISTHRHDGLHFMRFWNQHIGREWIIYRIFSVVRLCDVRQDRMWQREPPSISDDSHDVALCVARKIWNYFIPFLWRHTHRHKWYTKRLSASRKANVQEFRNLRSKLKITHAISFAVAPVSLNGVRRCNALRSTIH